MKFKDAIFVIATCVCVMAASADPNPTDPRPNIIIVFADDLGTGDLGTFRELFPGGESDQPQAHHYTPVIDRLANEGIRFTRTYASSWCAPSRQILLSGQWANRADAYIHPWIGAMLREQGYVTAMIGKSHGDLPTQKTIGNTDPGTAEFDDTLAFIGGMRDFYMKPGETFPGRRDFAEATFTAEGGEYVTDVFTDRAVEFIAREAGNERPFMLYLAHIAPHSPLQGKLADMRELFPDTFGDLSDAEIMATAWPEGRGGKYEAHHYAAMVYSMDRGLARIIETLRGAGVFDNTLIIVTSDNGAIHGSNYPLTGNKWDLLEGGIRVPMILWMGNSLRPKGGGIVHDGLTSLADIAPTLYGLATDEPYPYPTDGMDLIPRLLGNQPPAEARRFFWANASNPSLSRYMTDLENFDSTGKHRKIVQSVLVQDQDKIVRWRIPESELSGVVYKHLPDVRGKSAPAKTLSEQGPRIGVFPFKGPGLQLLDTWHQLVDEENLLSDWSGVPVRPLAEIESSFGN